MSEITKDQAVNLAIVLASWHVDWMRLRLNALSLSDDTEIADFLWRKFPTLQGTPNIVALEQFASLPADMTGVMATIRAILDEKESG